MDTQIARAIAHAQQQMHRAATVEDTLEVIVRGAAEALTTFDHVGISTVGKDGGLITRASTTELVLELDDLQDRLREGPGLDSLDGHDVMSAPRLEDEERWSRYLPGALALGVRSQLVLRLHLDDHGTIGGLNLSSTTSEDIAEQDVAVAAFFAAHASLVLGKVRHTESLNQAMASRQLIGKAIGVLMERYDISDQTAHAFLWRASSHISTRVHTVATHLVDGADATRS